jgi:tape measure domain-containing protein
MEDEATAQFRVVFKDEGIEIIDNKVKKVTRSVADLQAMMAKGFAPGAQVSGAGSIFDPTVIKSAEEAFKRTGKAAKDARGDYKDAADALTFFQKVFVAREIVKFTEAIEELSDTLTNLQNKMKVLSENEGAGGTVESRMRAIIDIAEQTGQPLETVSTGFFRISEATKEMGANTAQVSRVVKTLNEAMAVNKATSVEAKNGMIQLTQGLSLGVVKGQDLRAVISDIPTIGRLIADHFKVSIGVLREMASQGKVTATEVMKALLEGSEQMDTKFGKMGETFERAWNTFKTKGIDAFAPILEATNGFTTAIDK